MRRLAAACMLTFLAALASPAIAAADEPPARGSGKKKSGCSVAAEDDAVLGLAALVLVVAGVALRRRP